MTSVGKSVPGTVYILLLSPCVQMDVQMQLDVVISVSVRLQWASAGSDSSRDVGDSRDSSGDGVVEVVRPHSEGGEGSVIVLSSTLDVSSVVEVSSDELSGSECSSDDESASDDDEEAMAVQLPTCCYTFCEGAASVVVWQCAHVYCAQCVHDFQVHAVPRCPVCRCESHVE